MNHRQQNIQKQIIKALEAKDYQAIDQMKLSDEEAKWMFQQQRFLSSLEEIDLVITDTHTTPIPTLTITTLAGGQLQYSLKNYTIDYLDKLSAWLLPSSNSLAYTRNASSPNHQESHPHDLTDTSEIIKTKYFSVSSVNEKTVEIIFSKEVKQINIEEITTSNHSPLSLTEKTSGKDYLTPAMLNLGNYRLEINNQETLELVLKPPL